jgi:hypothetical protein
MQINRTFAETTDFIPLLRTRRFICKWNVSICAAVYSPCLPTRRLKKTEEQFNRKFVFRWRHHISPCHRTFGLSEHLYFV